jgi:hypothetical protein
MEDSVNLFAHGQFQFVRHLANSSQYFRWSKFSELQFMAQSTCNGPLRVGLEFHVWSVAYLELALCWCLSSCDFIHCCACNMRCSASPKDHSELMIVGYWFLDVVICTHIGSQMVFCQVLVVARCWRKSPSSWEPQEEGMMSTAANFPSVRNQGLSVQ